MDSLVGLKKEGSMSDTVQNSTLCTYSICASHYRRGERIRNEFENRHKNRNNETIAFVKTSVQLIKDTSYHEQSVW